MGENKSILQHHANEKFVWDTPAKGGALVIALMAAGLAIGVLNKKNGPESSASGEPTSILITEKIEALSDKELFMEIQKKVKDNPDYVPNRDERFVLQKFGMAVSDGYIPYKGDGKEEKK